MKNISILIPILLFITVLSGCAAPTPTATLAPTLESTATPSLNAGREEFRWWNDAAFYEIFVRSFYDSNGDGIGDFNGITRKLDYLQQLGVNAIWLMPIHPSPSYHGYDVLDYYAVNPDYGTLDDFKRLLAEAHKRNIHIIIDLVLNHTSNEHPWFMDASSDPNSPHRDWYIWSDKEQGNNWYPIGNSYYYALFCDCMPDLNYRNPQVTAEMEKVVRFWLDDIGVDGFRIDAAKHLIEEGDKIENTKSTHEWFKGFYQAYKMDNPNAYAVGEVFNAGASLAKTYTGDQLDQVFNFELASSILNSVNGGSNSGVDSALTFAAHDLPDGNYASFLTNHDQNRAMSAVYGDVNKAKLAAFLLLTSPGTPFLYYGEEIGMQGEKPDEDIRRPMQWDASNNAGFTTGNPWEAPDTNYTEANVAAQENDPNSLLNFYKEMIALRNRHSALRTGSLALFSTGDSGLYASLRVDDDEALLILANLSNHTVRDTQLTLTKSPLQPGKYSVTPLFGKGNFAPVQMDAGGQINEYKLLNETPAYGMHVLQLTFTK